MSTNRATIDKSNNNRNPDSVPDNKPKENPLQPNLEDPYKYAPPKPDGDPWVILLTPELEADKTRCDSWKEEVQTLLIFAGLFSAVVTAFVIESYKFLKPDPNDAIIGLLFHIANLNASSPSPPVVPASIITSFTQTPSSVRINVFWFLSLILSLTTVLAGTIALQWLREHQSYTGYSAKETLAILNMRSEAIEVWYVPQIFAGLPLLLQAALVLFLVGLIDFSRPLGPKLTIPVAIVVGLTLLFLVATTILPTLQAISFLTGLYSRRTVPAPCAFRSPQSYAFHSLSRILLRAVSFIIPQCSILPDENGAYRDLPTDRQYLKPHLYIIWDQETYDFDFEWLSLRDACQQFILDGAPDLYEHRQCWDEEFPLSDITQCVVDVVKEEPSHKHTELYLTAAYYCFQDISSSIWTKPQWGHGRNDRRNNYFQQLQENDSHSDSTPTILLHGGAYKWERFSDTKKGDHYMYTINHSSLFFEDQKFLFLCMLLEVHDLPTFRRHHSEMWSRITQHLLISNIAPLTPPDFYLPHPFCLYPLRYLSPMDYFLTSDADYDHSDIVDLLNTIFRSVASGKIAQDRLADTKYYIGQQLLQTLLLLALTTGWRFRRAKNINTSNRKDLKDITEMYSPIFIFAATCLDNDTSTSSFDNAPSPLSYLSAIFIQQVMLHSHPHDINLFGQEFRNMFHALRRYRIRMSGRKNEPIETQFMDKDPMSVEKADLRIGRFSDEWWDTLFSYLPGDSASDDVGIIEQQGLSTEKNGSSHYLKSPLVVSSAGSLENAADTPPVSSGPIHPDTVVQNPTYESGTNNLKVVLQEIPVIDVSSASGPDLRMNRDSFIDVIAPIVLGAQGDAEAAVYDDLMVAELVINNAQ